MVYKAQAHGARLPRALQMGQLPEEDLPLEWEERDWGPSLEAAPEWSWAPHRCREHRWRDAILFPMLSSTATHRPNQNLSSHTPPQRHLSPLSHLKDGLNKLCLFWILTKVESWTPDEPAQTEAFLHQQTPPEMTMCSP